MPRFDWNRTSPLPSPSPVAPVATECWWAPPGECAHLLYEGDNLAVLNALEPAIAGTVRLIYIDPPFFTGREWSMKFPGLGMERVAFADSKYGGVDGFLQFLHERLVILHRLLTADGTLFLHLDYRVAHYARLVLEEVFGPDQLLNEIIWSYASGGGSGQRFGRKHDTILWFAKSDRHLFNPDAVRVPYRAVIAPSRAELFNEGGMVCPDVWDISRGRNGSGPTGYPTEKPPELLDRIVLAASDEGDLVLDAFAGSGTLADSAARHGRRSISIDRSPLAIQAQRRRLSLLAVPFALHRLAPVAPQPLAVPIRVDHELAGFTLSLETPGNLLLEGWCIDTVDSENDPLAPVWMTWREKKDRWPLLTSDPMSFDDDKALVRISCWTVEGECFVSLIPRPTG